MKTDYRTLIKNLNKIGVDTRYISIYEGNIYINNLKFSKFSRKKEEEFHKIYPDMQVIRSTLLQKICIRVSRTVKDKIKPRDSICIEDNNLPETILLHVVLESYKRKYGITITKDSNEARLNASAKCLDDFTNEYINLMISGNKITDTYQENTIYPLAHIEYKQIIDWIDSTNIACTKNEYEPNQVIEFLEKHVPNVKESIKQSVTYLDENRIE